MEKLTALREIVTTLAAGIGAVVAIVGVHTWRAQLKGTTEFEAARRLMLAIYKVREALQAVRVPMMLSGEMYEALKEQGQNPDAMSPKQVSSDGSRAVYQKRWQAVAVARNELDLELLEAELLWAQEIKDATIELRRVYHILSAALIGYLQFRGNLAESGVGSDEFLRIRDLVFRAEEDDAFTRELNAAVGRFEEILRSKMQS